MRVCADSVCLNVCALIVYVCVIIVCVSRERKGGGVGCVRGVCVCPPGPCSMPKVFPTASCLVNPHSPDTRERHVIVMRKERGCVGVLAEARNLESRISVNSRRK